MPTTNVYDALTEAGVPTDHHESDLYAKVTPDSTRIFRAFGTRPTVFRSQLDGELWYDAPFAYTPYWVAVQDRASRITP